MIIKNSSCSGVHWESAESYKLLSEKCTCTQNFASNFMEFTDCIKSIDRPCVMNSWLNPCCINLQQYKTPGRVALIKVKSGKPCNLRNQNKFLSLALLYWELHANVPFSAIRFLATLGDIADCYFNFCRLDSYAVKNNLSYIEFRPLASAVSEPVGPHPCLFSFSSRTLLSSCDLQFPLLCLLYKNEWKIREMRLEWRSKGLINFDNDH